MKPKVDRPPPLQFSSPIYEAHARMLLRWRPEDRVELLHALCCSLIGTVDEAELRATDERIRPWLDEFHAGHNYLDALGVVWQLSSLLRKRVRGEHDG